mgnify:CR=1 FL=1
MILAVVLLGGLAFFSRDPERSAVGPPGGVSSTADGRAIEVREIALPEFGPSRGPCISLFRSIFDVHVNRHLAPAWSTMLFTGWAGTVTLEDPTLRQTKATGSCSVAGNTA